MKILTMLLLAAVLSGPAWAKRNALRSATCLQRGPWRDCAPYARLAPAKLTLNRWVLGSSPC